MYGMTITADAILLQHPNAHAVALNKKAFGEGAERFAFRFFEITKDGKTVVGKPLVAKESRLVLEGGKKDRGKFVRTFLETQQLAGRIATEFNKRLECLHRVDKQTPRVSFLDCSVYELDDINIGKQSVLVEEKLDHLKWYKWNMNNGFVAGMKEAPEFTHDKMMAAMEHLATIDIIEEKAGEHGLGDLGAIEEGEEDESDDDRSSTGDTNHGKKNESLVFSPFEVAQAFSHFSYYASGKKRLICDLQGVFEEKSNLLKFSDPVIHYHNPHRQERRGVHGRTDRGKKGMAMFFDTHKEHCGRLCRLVTGGFRQPRRCRQRHESQH